MSIADEEASKKAGHTVYMHVEVQGHVGVASGVTKIVAQGGKMVRGKPVKRIEYRKGRDSDHSMIIMRDEAETKVLKIAWLRSGAPRLALTIPAILWEAEVTSRSDKGVN